MGHIIEDYNQLVSVSAMQNGSSQKKNKKKNEKF